jgi:Predicted pyridoxal phosphate-dependent enzyme apparently involved in regulation of cell wall biogenesis
MKNKRIYLSPPHMSRQEKQLLVEAFDSNWIAPLAHTWMDLNPK